MISVIIPVRDSEERLALSLAALAPLALQGLIADVVVADQGSRDATLKVADATGCAILEPCGDLDASIERAAGLARKDWLLGLLPGDLPDETVAKAALSHIAQSERTGTPSPAAYLALPTNSGALRRAARCLAFDMSGHAPGHCRRVLAPRAEARLLSDPLTRWRGTRMKERITVSGDWPSVFPR
jgi:hypothetical protein